MQKVEGMGTGERKENDRLPLLTIIAFWWMVLAVVVWTIGGLVLIAPAAGDSEFGMIWDIGVAIIFVSDILYLLPAFLIISKRQRAWIVAVVVLTIEMIALLFISDIRSHMLFIVLPAYLIPLILLMFDVNKYWAVTKKTVDGIQTSSPPVTEPDKEEQHPSDDL